LLFYPFSYDVIDPIPMIRLKRLLNNLAAYKPEFTNDATAQNILWPTPIQRQRNHKASNRNAPDKANDL